MEFLSNKWVEMKSLIKHVFFIYIAINITPNIYGQELIESINNSYKLLDTALYIDDIKLHVYNDLEAQQKESDKAIIELHTNNIDSVKKMYLLNLNNFSKQEFNNFTSIINNSQRMEFVLNLHTEKDTIDGNILYSLKHDTGNFIFNVWFFGKYQQPHYVVSVENGAYIGHGQFVVYSRKSGKMISKSFKQIMKKKPMYLLYCRELEGMNSILYVVNDKIYVYRTVEMKEYELQKYLEQYPLQLIP